MKKCLYLLGFCMLLFLGACQEDEEVVQKEEEQLPTLEEMEVALIAEESLNGWDVGISYKGGYCVGKCDTIDGVSTLYFNSPNSDVEDGIVMSFNENSEIVSIFFNKQFFLVNQEDDYIHYYQMDNEGKMVANYKYKSKNKNNTTTRGLVTQFSKITFKRFLKLLEIGADKGLDVGDIRRHDTSQSYVDGNYNAALTFLGFAAAGTVATLAGASLPVLFGIIVADFAVDKILDCRYESARKHLYGDAEVSIVSVSNNSEKDFTIVLEISNANTIPYKYWEWFFSKEYDNTVECGVVASKKHISLPSFYNHEAITTVLLQPNISRRIITITMPEKYYSETITFRPFLVSDREYENKNSTDFYSYIAFSRGRYIRYGESYDYRVNSSSIYWTETTSAEYERDAITFKGDVEIFNWCSKGEQWGLYINLDNGLKGRFPAQNQNTSITSVQFTVPINDENLYLDYEKWTATYKKEIGVYHIDEEGNYTYGEMKECEFVYREQPSIEFVWAEILGTREQNSESTSRAAAPGPGGEGGEDEDEDDSDEKEYITEFAQTFKVEGALWMDYIEYKKVSGTPTFEVVAGKVQKDKTFTTRGKIKYNAKMPNISAITRYNIVLRNGRTLDTSLSNFTYYKNHLYWSGENEITNVEWK